MRRFNYLCCLLAAVLFFSPISGCGGGNHDTPDDTPVMQDMNIQSNPETAEDKSE